MTKGFDFDRERDIILIEKLQRGQEKEYIETYLREIGEIIQQIDRDVIEKMVNVLKQLREKGGRLFFVGLGGGAANASHAVNDFRKVTGIEAYTPADNVSELLAQANDEGWDKIFVNWLKESKLSADDALFVFSVRGGSIKENKSVNIIEAIKYAKEVGAAVIGVVGREDGYTAKEADICLVIPCVNPAYVAPYTESLQAVIWHLLAFHPDFRKER